MKKIFKWSIPITYITILFVLIPQFDKAFTFTLSFVRVEIGKMILNAGFQSGEAGILLGIYKPEVPYSLSMLDSLEQSLNKKFNILSFYQTWGERDEDVFPFEIMRETDRHESIVMVTWEPWLTEFKKNKKSGAVNLKTDLRTIANGEYDNYVREWAREAVVYGKPFFLRFAHEMNNAQYPWSTAAGNNPKDFVDAWRHVHKIFRDEGAKNVIFVWSPKGTMPNEYYPGGEYVDWIGAGVFNYGSYADDVWHSFEFVYEPIYRSALRYEKPIMIAELGCSPLGGNQAQWYADAFKIIPKSYSETKAIILFNNPADNTLSGSTINWSIDANPEVLKILREQILRKLFR